MAKIKLTESRLIRLWILSSLFNLFVFVSSLGLFWVINWMVINGAYGDTLSEDFILQLLRITMVSVVPSQATITTAIIARYGAREAAAAAANRTTTPETEAK